MPEKLLLSKEDLEKPKSLSRPRTYLVRDTTKDFHCAEGVITAADLGKTDGNRVTSNMGKRFCVIDPSWKDRYQKIERGAQVIPLKEVGAIITEAGINKESIVVDAGAGSGALAAFLAGICCHVTTYDIREDHLATVQKNIVKLGLVNLTAKLGDFYQGIEERGADLVTLDLPEPWRGLETAASSLKVGGHLIAYNPSIPQISDFVEAIRADSRFMLIRVIEIIEREWEMDGRKVRPKSKSSIHSGFLAVTRFISSDKI